MTHFIKYRDDILTQSVTHVFETLSAITFIHDENINVNIKAIYTAIIRRFSAGALGHKTSKS